MNDNRRTRDSKRFINEYGSVYMDDMEVGHNSGHIKPCHSMGLVYDAINPNLKITTRRFYLPNAKTVAVLLELLGINQGTSGEYEL
jgi:hypothetical protein